MSDDLPLRDLPPHIVKLLSSPVVTALDAYFRARYQTATLTMAGDTQAVAEAIIQEREQHATYFALLVERLDSRAAHFLADMYVRQDAADARIRALAPTPADAIDDPTGFDAGRQP